jgi:hypothetical protein
MFFVKVLSDLNTTNRKIVKIKKSYVKEINKEAVVPYALINHSNCCCFVSYNTNNCDYLAII